MVMSTATDLEGEVGEGGEVAGWSLHSSLDYRGRLGDTTIHCVVTAVDHIGVQVVYIAKQCIAFQSSLESLSAQVIQNSYSPYLMPYSLTSLITSGRLE